MKKEVIITAVCLMAVTGFSAPRPASMFVEIDTNKDGKATLEELDIWFKARAERTGTIEQSTDCAKAYRCSGYR